MKLLSLVSEETSRGEHAVNYTDWLTDYFADESEDDVRPLIELGKVLIKLGATWHGDDSNNRHFELHPGEGQVLFEIFVQGDGQIRVFAEDGNDRFSWGPIGGKDIMKIDWDEFISGATGLLAGLNVADHAIKYGSRKNVQQK